MISISALTKLSSQKISKRVVVMKSDRNLTVVAFFVFSLVVGLARAQTPIGNLITYQGRMDLAGTPLDGLTDFEFDIYSALEGGTPIGQTDRFRGDNAVDVVNGLFTVQIDGSGPGMFDGDARWLEIRVRHPASSGGNDPPFTTLSPRQRITPAMYANYASRASWQGLQDLPVTFNAVAPGSVFTINNLFDGAGDPKAIHGIIDPGTFTFGDDYPAAVFGENNDTNHLGYGVWGKSAGGTGVYGLAANGDGVQGRSLTGAGPGVRGVAEGTGDGVVGDARGMGTGVAGVSRSEEVV